MTSPSCGNPKTRTHFRLDELGAEWLSSSGMHFNHIYVVHVRVVLVHRNEGRLDDLRLSLRQACPNISRSGLDDAAAAWFSKGEYTNAIAGMCGSSISVDLRSQRVEQGHKRHCNVNRRDHDDGHHHSQHGDPGPSGPTGQPRPRDKCSGRRPDLERRPMRRDERSADPLLPANRHPHRFPPRADPPPRQAPVSPVPEIERLDSIIQIRRREQPPQQLLVFRSSAAHMFPDFYRRPTDISNTRRVWHTSSIANTDLIRSHCCRFVPGAAGARRVRRRAVRRSLFTDQSG